MMVAWDRCSSTAARISSAVRTCTRETPAGGLRWTGPETRTTRAPRAAAASASAYPIFPLERLERKRTGSSGSSVGPAVTSTVSPSRSRGRFSSARTAAAIRSGSARRPGPTMPQARAPSSGSTMVCPRPRKVSRLRRVAGWFHMLVFIAGASTTGPVKARYRVERKSSARPWANFASRSAVAGATTRAWASCATRMCSTALASVSSPEAANRSVITLRAGQRGEGERTDELLRRAGHHHLHGDAALDQRTRASSAALYAAIPPPMPRTAFMPAPPLNLLGGGRLFRRRRRRRRRVLVLHQPAAHLLHGGDGGLLRGGRQERARSALKLPRPLGGDDDEPVRALLRVVRDAMANAVACSAVVLVERIRACNITKLATSGFERRQDAARTCCSILVRRTRSAFTIDASVSTDVSTSWFTST